MYNPYSDSENPQIFLFLAVMRPSSQAKSSFIRFLPATLNYEMCGAFLPLRFNLFLKRLLSPSLSLVSGSTPSGKFLESLQRRCPFEAFLHHFSSTYSSCFLSASSAASTTVTLSRFREKSQTFGKMEIRRHINPPPSVLFIGRTVAAFYYERE